MLAAEKELGKWTAEKEFILRERGLPRRNPGLGGRKEGTRQVFQMH